MNPCPAPYEDWPADLVLTHGFWLVRLAQTAPGEPPTWAGHVAGVVEPGRVLQALTWVREGDWSAVSRPYQAWRHAGLTWEQRLAIAAEARKFKGRLYGAWKLGLQLGDNLLARGLHVFGHHGEVYAFRRLTFADAFPICNLVWAWPYEKAADYRFGEAARLTSPDDMLDWLQQRPEWVLVHREDPA